MSPVSMVSYGPSQQLHPLSLLAQVSSRFSSGCLQVSDGSTSWMLYFEQGQLTFASNSAQPFERLDRHLRQLSRQVPSLVSAVRVQVRLLFESPAEAPPHPSADYRAIRWLVEQHYLDPSQVPPLVQALAQEVLEPFLALTSGSHDFLAKEQVDDFPQLCRLELRPLVEHCQAQLRRRQPPLTPGAPRVGPAAQPASPAERVPTSPASPPTAKGVLLWKAKAEEALTPAAPPLLPKGHYTIACIDDSPTILQAMKAFLDDASFTLIMINDPIKALMQVIRSKPDVILLDVGMPNLDGYELCSLLRRHAHFKHTPIIMVTGHTGFIDRAKAKLVGASGYLTKPFTQSELLKMVFKHLT
ncbi:response regulator [Leptothermofonsia sp. ETS-13]|uniref:response regulator n=1 Tax=Leptothermofonsia sp. ETS-13 TaxID=3035696 RepID=UPI003B9FD9D8